MRFLVTTCEGFGLAAWVEAESLQEAALAHVKGRDLRYSLRLQAPGSTATHCVVMSVDGPARVRVVQTWDPSGSVYTVDPNLTAPSEAGRIRVEALFAEGTG